MRRNLRIFLIIGVMFTLAVLVLWNQEVDLPGDSFDRGGTGPLGLVLGLDLRGGAHLVYQADRPVTLNTTFAQPISESDLKEGLDKITFGQPTSESEKKEDLDKRKLGPATITTFEREEFSLDVPGIDEEGVGDFMAELQAEVGAATSHESSIEDRTQIHISLVELPSQGSVGNAIRGLGYPDVLVATVSRRDIHPERASFFHRRGGGGGHEGGAERGLHRGGTPGGTGRGRRGPGGLRIFQSGSE